MTKHVFCLPTPFSKFLNPPLNLAYINVIIISAMRSLRYA